MRTSLVWDKFLIEKKKIVSSEEIGELSVGLSKNSDRVIDYLQHNGYIVRIFRGIFYVKSLEERERKKYDISIYEMIALAMGKKGVENWYFGLETALKLNNMTHEYFTIDFILTDSYRTTKVIEILDRRFQFLKRTHNYFTFGIIEKNGFRYSDKEKTILDIAYKKYRENRESTLPIRIIQEYSRYLDEKKFKKYLKHYPKRFQNAIGGSL